jgi:autotransporter translocation and assembly factor TamB
MQNGSIQVNGFNLSSDSQSIALNGRISPDSKDQLQMVLHNLDLGVVNAFMPEGGLQLEGILDGYASVLSPVPSEFGLSANLALDDLKLWGREAGNIRLISDWDDAQKLINYKLTNTSGDEQILRLTGNYGIKSKVIDASLGMDGFDAGLAAPVLKSVLSELSGKLYGTVKAHGRLDKPVLSSEGIRLVDLRTRVAYTNVAYIMNGTLGLNDKGLQFNGIGVKDEYGGLGVLNGSLGFKELKNFKLDANLDMYKLKAIDIPVKGSSALYGDLAVTGNGRISGPFNALHIDADLATAGAGNVNVPIPSSSAASGSDLLTFVTPEVEQEEGSQKTAGATPVPAPKNGKLSIHAKMGISPEVIANVEID